MVKIAKNKLNNMDWAKITRLARIISKRENMNYNIVENALVENPLVVIEYLVSDEEI